MMRAMRAGALLWVVLVAACTEGAGGGAGGAGDGEGEGGDSGGGGAGEGAPDAAPPLVRFAVLGDSGTGTQAQYEVAAALRDVCAEEGCDFVLMLGDNLYSSGAESVDDPIWQEAFEAPYAGIELPFYAVLGNHDYGGELLGFQQGGLGNQWERGPIEVAYTEKSDRWRMPATHYVLRSGPVGIVALDTNSILWGNQDHGDQRAWWPGALAEASAGSTWVIAAGHHPYRSNGSHGNAGTYEMIEELDITVPIDEISGDKVRAYFDEFVCGNVDLYLAGHDHNRQWIDEPEVCGGTELVVNGASGKIKALEERGNTVLFQNDTVEGFMHITIDGATLTGRFIDKDGTVSFTHTLTK